MQPQDSDDDTQRWFWTARWQRLEREADDDIAAGRIATFDDVDGFLADLDRDDRERDPASTSDTRPPASD